MKRSAKFDKILALDVETSGLNRTELDPSIGYQIVSIGMIMADTTTFTPSDQLYLEIQWNGEAKWDNFAESIHGLSRDYLVKHGLTEEEAVEKIALFLDKHYGTDTAITCLGQNVSRFDVAFNWTRSHYRCQQ